MGFSNIIQGCKSLLPRSHRNYHGSLKLASHLRTGTTTGPDVRGLGVVRQLD